MKQIERFRFSVQSHNTNNHWLTYTVSQRGIAAWLRQQESNNVSMAVLACTHKRCGALVILEVDLCPLCQERLNHAHPAMAHSQHQGCLTSLDGEEQTRET